MSSKPILANVKLQSCCVNSLDAITEKFEDANILKSLKIQFCLIISLLIFPIIGYQTVLASPPQTVQELIELYNNLENDCQQKLTTSYEKNMRLLQCNNNAEKIKIEKKWDDYLKNNSDFDYNGFTTAVLRLHNQYMQAWTQCGKCSDDFIDKQKEYSSKWIRDLTAKFPQKEIIKKKETIKKIIITVHMKKSLEYCSEEKKEAVYSEVQLVNALNQYTKHFNKFYETLGANDKNILKTKKIAMEQFLEIYNENPFQKMIADMNLIYINTCMRLENYEKTDPYLTEFFLKHPIFRQPFPMKAIYEIDSLSGS